MMKTDMLSAREGVNIDSAISLDNFIVRETLAPDALVAPRPKVGKNIFTRADLWNIRRRSKMAGIRRSR